MTNISAAPAVVQPASNRDFLERVFGVSRWQDAHVTQFRGDPGVHGWWGGRRAGSAKLLEDAGLNQYFTVSQFWDDSDGRARRQGHLFRGLHVVIVDDVGPKVDPARLAKMPPPTYRIETSPGNEQWGWVLELPELDRGRAETVSKEMIDRGLTADHSDPGMRGVTRYVRLPFGTNGKAAYGGNWKVRVIEWDPTRVYTLAEVVEEPWGFTLPAPGTVSFSQGRGGVLDPAVAAQDPVLAAQDELGWIRSATANKWGFECTCPCIDEHTDQADTGCAYRPGPSGTWVCHHGHCRQAVQDAQGHTGPRPWYQYYRRLEEALAAAGLKPLRAREFSVIAETNDPVAPGVVVSPRKTFLSEYVFAAPDNGFYNLRSRTLEPRASINSVWGPRLAPDLAYDDGKGGTKHLPVDKWYFGQPGHRVVEGYTYWPGRDEVLVHNGVTLANRYRQRELPARVRGPRVGTREVQPWLRLVKHVLGAEGGRAIVRFLDWCGAVLSEPELKPGWMVVVQGEQGIGKDLIMSPVLAAVGEENRASIKGDDLGSAFTGYAEKRLIVVKELRQTTRGSTSGHDQYNRLKWLVDTTAELLPINPKYGRPYDARNVSAVFVSTNEPDAVALEDTDRRALVFVSGAKQWPAVRYAELVAWLEALDGWELVTAWLVQRWARIGQNRRAAVKGNAPRTRGRETMIRAAGGPVLEWVQGHVERAETAEWPTIITAAQVVDNVSRALSAGGKGLPRHLRAPTARQAGKLLAQLGAAKLAGGEQVRLKDGSKVHLWAIRNKDNLASLGGAALAKLVEEKSASEFNGPQVVAGNFGGERNSEEQGNASCGNEAEGANEAPNEAKPTP